MFRSDEFRKKIVINIRTAEKLGYIRDIDISFENGRIESIIIPGGLVRMPGKARNHIIPWKNIVKIGPEVVLVDYMESIKCN